MGRLLVGLWAVFLCGGCVIAAPPSDLYLGYFQEDADPRHGRVGIVSLRLAADSFEGGILYAVDGCRPGEDGAAVQGRRMGAELAGVWQGEVDGVPIGGSFAGRADSGGLGGSYAHAAGPARIDCDVDGRSEYQLAPLGRWRLWPLGKAPLPLSVRASALSWRPVGGASHYRLLLFDGPCLARGGPLGSCLRVDADHDGPPVRLAAYADSLRPRRAHLALIMAIGADGAPLSLGSTAFPFP